jgi:hypothetical protein
MIKLRSFATLCAIMLCGLTAPALAIPKEEASCGYTGIAYENPMVPLAYDVIDNLSFSKTQSEKDYATIGVELNKKISICKIKYQWTDAIADDGQDYAFGILALWGAQLKFKAAMVDYAPIGIELGHASADDWMAIENANGDAAIYQRLIAILNKQGFTREKNSDVFNILGNYATITSIIRSKKIKLSIWNGN